MQVLYWFTILLVCWILSYITWDAITWQLEHERAEVRHGE